MVGSHELILDNEILGFLNRVKRGFEVNAETLTKDLIGRVGPGGQFLQEMHTHRHLKSEHLVGVIFIRSVEGAE